MRQGKFRTELRGCDDIICGKEKKEKKISPKTKIMLSC